MRKWNLIICVVLVILAFAHSANSGQVVDVNEPNIPAALEFNNGLTLSGLFQDGTIDDAPDGWGRLGYQYGSLEPFFGLAFDVESFEIGFKLFSRNAVTDVKYFSDLLAAYFNPETMEIRGYSGAHRVIAKDKEDTYTGAILGIEQKEIGSPLSLTAEAQFNDDNRIFYYIGLKWGF